MRKKIYLAGPEVFLPNAVDAGNRKKALCEKYGFKGVYPIDANINIADLPPRAAGLKISSANENLICGCQLLIANITPFRGPSADVGTVFEIGFAHAKGLTVFAYTNVAESFEERTRDMIQVSKHEDGIWRDLNNMAVESFGLTDNLMIDGAIINSGGKLFVEDVPENERYTNLDAFEQCLTYLQKQTVVSKN